MLFLCISLLLTTPQLFSLSVLLAFLKNSNMSLSILCVAKFFYCQDTEPKGGNLKFPDITGTRIPGSSKKPGGSLSQAHKPAHCKEQEDK